MKLKLHTLPIAEQWNCHHCTACCRETTIQLNENDLAKLARQKWNERPEFQAIQTVRRSWMLGGTQVLNHKEDGSCVFLTPAGRCRIHEEFGPDAKPLMCRQFPLQVVATDRQTIATVARSCPSAAADRGRPVGEHLAFLKHLLGNEIAPSAVAPPLVGKISRGWNDFHKVADAIERLLVDQRLPLVRRIVHVIRFCNLLESCKLKRVSSDSLPELIQAMEELAAADAGHLFQDRQPPTRRAAKLFRRLGAHFIRCVPGGEPIRTLGDQWRVMQLSGQLARGKALLPQVHPQFSAIAVDHLERALGPLNAEILHPLPRLYAAHALSNRYALARPQNSLVDSARRLAFTFPMALWMLRWLAHDREPTADDMVQIVVALERGMVLPALNRAARYLSESGELERLAAWYSR